jgi:hypothetical protein
MGLLMGADEVKGMGWVGTHSPFLRLPIPHDVPQAFVAGLDA